MSKFIPSTLIILFYARKHFVSIQKGFLSELVEQRAQRPISSQCALVGLRFGSFVLICLRCKHEISLNECEFKENKWLKMNRHLWFNSFQRSVPALDYQHLHWNLKQPSTAILVILWKVSDLIIFYSISIIIIFAFHLQNVTLLWAYKLIFEFASLQIWRRFTFEHRKVCYILFPLVCICV